MSCDRQMRQTAKIATANGISPLASQSAHYMRYPSLMDIYAKNLSVTDIQNLSELYNYLRLGKLPRPKEHATGNYLLAGIGTALDLARLRKQKQLTVKRQQATE